MYFWMSVLMKAFSPSIFPLNLDWLGTRNYNRENGTPGLFEGTKTFISFDLWPLSASQKIERKMAWDKNKCFCNDHFLTHSGTPYQILKISWKYPKNVYVFRRIFHDFPHFLNKIKAKSTISIQVSIIEFISTFSLYHLLQKVKLR